MGSFINLMICPEAGDRLLDGAVMKRGGALDENYIIIETTQERVDALVPAIELVGRKKIGRKIRTRTTVNLPRKVWTWCP